MYDLGLSAADQRELMLLLFRSHRLKIRIQMMDLDHNYLADISDRFLDGSVDISTEADVTRSLKLSLLDPDKTLRLDPNNPGDGSMYLNRMVQVRYCVGRMDNSKWWEIPVFTGPLSKVDRNGVVLQVEGQGKESMSRDLNWVGKSYGKGWNRGSLIRRIMMDLAGERKLKLESTKSKTASTTSMTRSWSPFTTARSIASHAKMRLYYDGAGYLRMSRRKNNTVFTFGGTTLLSKPQVGYSIENVYNAVEVRGAIPKGSKAPVRYRIVADRSHPLSPQNLSRGGVARVIPLYIEDDKLKTVSACKTLAKSTLAQGLLQGIDATIECMPNPLLEEFDVISIRTEEFVGSTVLTNATLPLSAGGSMSIGYNKRIKPSKLSKIIGRL